MSDHPAIAVVELDSVPAGTQVADAMIKRAPLDVLRVGTVQPGKYVIVVRGSVAAVEEAHCEALRLGGAALLDHVLLPEAHRQVHGALQGDRRKNAGDALGIIESGSIPATVEAADRAVKTAKVEIVELRLGDGLGGRGLLHVSGALPDIQEAVQAGVNVVQRREIPNRWVVIPLQHAALRAEIDQSTRFVRR